MTRRAIIIAGLTAALLLPVAAFAQAGLGGGDTPLDTAITRLLSWISRLTVLILAAAVLVFVWGVLKFITAAGDDEKRKSGRSFMIWGIIGIFVMVSVWALVRLLTETVGPAVGGLNYQGLTPPAIPQ